MLSAASVADVGAWVSDVLFVGTEDPLAVAAVTAIHAGDLMRCWTGGAEIDAPAAVIGGGTPLDEATALAQWQAARRLVERGAKTATELGR
jgi:hypothetical protein